MIKTKNNNFTLNRRWNEINQFSISDIDSDLAKGFGKERFAWNKFLEFILEINYLYESIGYYWYPMTIKRGSRNTDINTLKQILHSSWRDFNRLHFKNTIQGLEIPMITFEGNAIDGSYNPHLHCLIWIPRGYTRILKRFMKYSVMKELAKFKKRKLKKGERKEAAFWLKRFKGDPLPYIRYCGRLEDETKGKQFDKIVWELCSFGFYSADKHKPSKQIYRRIEAKFPQVTKDSSLRHKVYVMLHWIHKRKDPKAMLRIFLPTLTTDHPKVERPRRTIPIREILVKDFEKERILKFDRCYFVIKKKVQNARV